MKTPNTLDYASLGWHPVGDEAYPEYQSERINPDNWIVQPAISDDGREGKLVWWFEHPDAEDGGEWVDDWTRCHHVNEYGLGCVAEAD